MVVAQKRSWTVSDLLLVIREADEVIRLQKKFWLRDLQLVGFDAM
jgi:hypothetical protein